jgi:histone H3/H4
MESDIHNASSALGFGVAVGINPSTKTLSLKTGPSSAPSSGATKRKAKHGVVTARQVRFQQRNSNSFVFQKKNFLGMVKAIVRDPSAMNFMFGTVDLDNIRFSKNVINMIQLIIESYLLAMCSSARTVVEGMGQKTVSEVHFKVVLEVLVSSSVYSRFIQNANLEFNSTIAHSASSRRPAPKKAGPKKAAPKKAAAKTEKTKAKGKAPKKAAAEKPKAKAKGKGKGGKKVAPKAPAKKGMKLKK